MYYVYILLNEARTRTYTGVADDVNKRLGDHNAGSVKSSRPYRPYKIIHTEAFETLGEARQKEKFYKTTTGVGNHGKDTKNNNGGSVGKILKTRNKNLPTTIFKKTSLK